MDDLELRIATAADWAPLAPLMERFNEGEGIPWRPETMGPAFEMLTRDGTLGFALIAWAAGSPIGYLVVTYGFDLEWAGRDAFLTELYVTPPARGRGLALGMLREADGRAHADGAGALHLAVLPANNAAMALYRRAGFEVVPRTMMTKRLAFGSR